jgi:hypothetical protein
MPASLPLPPARAEGTPTPEFAAYIEQRGYSLLTLEVRGVWLCGSVAVHVGGAVTSRCGWSGTVGCWT